MTPPVLSDGVVRLRPWRLDDAPLVARACADPEIQARIPVPTPYTLADGEAFMALCLDRYAASDDGHLAIDDVATDRLIGSITRHPPEGHRATIGYWMAPWGRGHGHMARALRLLVDATFATTDLVRLELFTDPDNVASQRTAERAGFEREGVLRAWFSMRGTPVDVVMFSRLRTDLTAGGA
ncbi:MAG TPA: GNAT family protein [Candidatus Limnocylindrales bacterium]|nr:GNAT family protein [Candidatus Limnocylindrales bacterium]